MSAYPPQQQTFFDKFGKNNHHEALQEEYNRHLKSRGPNSPDKLPQSRPSGVSGPNDASGNYNVGILPTLAQRDTYSQRGDYGKILEQQAREREMNERRKKQEELMLEKKLLEEGARNDPFGRDRQNYLKAYQRSIMNARNGFAGIGNQIVQSPSYTRKDNGGYETGYQDYAGNYFSNGDGDKQKKLSQQEELRRAYEQQIADKEYRKMEELRRKMLEEREEEERIRREKEMELMRQAEENNRRLQQQRMMQYPSEQTYREPERTVTEEPPYEPEEEVIEEEDPEEKLKAIKVGLYNEMTKQVQGVLSSEMQKLKEQLNQQSHLLRDQLLTLKSQVLMAEELKQDANSELHKLKQDIQGLDVFEEIRKRNLSKYLKNVSHLYTNTAPISDNGNFQFQFPTRRFKLETNGLSLPREGRNELELASDIQYLPVQEPTYTIRHDEPPDVMLRQSIANRSLKQSPDDIVMRPKGYVIPDNINMNTKNLYYQQAKADVYLSGKEFDPLTNFDDGEVLERNEKRLDALNNYNKEDEVEKLNMLLRESLLREKGW